MLRQISVSGFKSLHEFNLDIAPGVNIIVGPNGAGKTNIVSFFEFLSNLVNENVSEAVFRSGGVSSVFRHQSDSKRYPIKLSIVGKSENYRYDDYGRRRLERIKYEYDAEIKISKDLAIIFFDNQQLKVAISNSSGKYKTNRKSEILWDLHVASKASDSTRSKVQIHKLDLRKFRERYYYPFSDSKKEIIEMHRARLNRSDCSSVSLIQILNRFYNRIKTIPSDLSSGKAYNIHPGSVKNREDISTPVGIRADGSGTSATLFMLSKDSSQTNAGRVIRRFAPAMSSRDIQYHRHYFEKLKDLIKLVNNSIEDLSITLDLFDNFIRVNFLIKTESGTIRIPLQQMSDGTAKWVALMTAVLTNRNMFAIEEPENFLHPYMQDEVLKIIRENTEKSKGDTFAILTTHSETLLNAALPEEIIVVGMSDGKTNAERLKKPTQISQVLSETGFGLGHLYVSNGLDNA